jgi:group I intron endonuclease
MKRYYVYSLSSSEDNITKYIGITNNLNRRYNKHLHSHKHKNTKISSWIKSIINRGFKLNISIIEELEDYKSCIEKEVFYIKLFKSFGAELKNLTLGGEGSIGYKHTELTKNKISINNAKSRLGIRKYNIDDLTVKELFEKGKSNAEISKMLNVPNTAIKESRKRQSLFYQLPKNKNITKLDISYEDLYNLYINYNLSKKQISEKYNCSERTIKKYLSKHKIYKNA